MSPAPLASFADPYLAVLAQIQDFRAWLDAHERQWLRLVAAHVHRHDKSVKAETRRHGAWIAGLRNGLLELEWSVQDAMDKLQARLPILKLPWPQTALPLPSSSTANTTSFFPSLQRVLSIQHLFLRSTRCLTTPSTAAGPSLTSASPSRAPAAAAVAMEPRKRVRLIRRGRCAPLALSHRHMYPRSSLCSFISSTRSMPTPPAPPATHPPSKHGRFDRRRAHSLVSHPSCALLTLSRVQLSSSRFTSPRRPCVQHVVESLEHVAESKTGKSPTCVQTHLHFWGSLY